MAGGARKFRIFGFLLVAASLFFVAGRIIDTQIWTQIAAHGQVITMAIAAGGLVYAGAGVLLALAWLQIMRGPEGVQADGPGGGRGPLPSRTRLGIAAYASSQIAKYIPGNVFHFVGRHALGRRLGLELADLLEPASVETR